MTCRTTRRYLQTYAAGELEGAAAVRVKEHCEQCPGCAGELESYAGALAALEQAGRAQGRDFLEPPAALANLRLPVEAQNGRRLVWGAALANGVLAAVLAFMAFQFVSQRPAERDTVPAGPEFAAVAPEKTPEAAVPSAGDVQAELSHTVAPPVQAAARVPAKPVVVRARRAGAEKAVVVVAPAGPSEAGETLEPAVVDVRPPLRDEGAPAVVVVAEPEEEQVASHAAMLDEDTGDRVFYTSVGDEKDGSYVMLISHADPLDAVAAAAAAL